MNIARRSLLSAASLFGNGMPTVVLAKTLKFNNLQDEIDKAIEAGGLVQLPAGPISTAGLRISGPVHLQGVRGKTQLISLEGGPVLTLSDASHVTLTGIDFFGKDVPSTDELSRSAVVMAAGCNQLKIENCGFKNSPFSGLKLETCSGRITGNEFNNLGVSALFANNSVGLEISGNEVSDIGNNGIQVWRDKSGPDGSLIIGNRVSNIKANAGGDGQNGNAINVYVAGNVIIANNRVSDAAFSGIRVVSAGNTQVIGNSISRAGETALYVEFSFDGAVVANNIIEDIAFGISVTNFDVGGRLALVTGNIIRNAKRGTTINARVGHGIHAEADTLVSNNVIEDIESFAINLGWGTYARNLTAQGNIIRNCAKGITFSATEGAGKVLISGNMIQNASLAAIQGMDGETAATEDLMLQGAVVSANATLSNNIVTR